jgi:hypothetical protein
MVSHDTSDPALETTELGAVLDLIDELAEADAELGVLLTRTASALGRTVGMRTPHGVDHTATPRGLDSAARRPPHTVTHDLPGMGQVWIDAGHPAQPGMDTALLRRSGA